MTGLKHPHQIRIATSEPQPHAFKPCLNPRLVGQCVKCGRPKDHGIHREPKR